LNKTEKFILQKLGKDSLEELEKQDYIGLIRQLNKYGLRFEEQPEEVEEKLKDFYPVLTDYNREAKTINLAGKEKEVKEIEDIINDEKGKMNYIIEGDNFHGLKAIEKIYEGKVDLCLADVPYNTGNEFKYNDKKVNKDDNYRHSKWLSFIEKRFKLVKNLLSEDGILFVHIDDNEFAQLKLLLDDIFGEENLITNFVWVFSKSKNLDNIKVTGSNLGDIKKSCEYILCYSKTNNYSINLINKTNNNFIKARITNAANPINTITIPSGVQCDVKKLNIKQGSFLGGKSEPLKILNKNGLIISNYMLKKDLVLKGNLRNKNLLNRFFEGEEIIDRRGQKLLEVRLNSSGKPYTLKEKAGKVPSNVLSGFGDSKSSSNLLKRIFNGKTNFDYPKPIDLIKHLINLHSDKNSLVLDPFAGSGTTGHAVLDLNKEDGGNRNFILMTNNENTSLNKKYLIWNYFVENNIVEDYDKTKFTSTGKRYHYYKKYIDKNFPLNIDKHYNIEIKKEHQDNKNLQKFIETDQFKTFLKNLKLYIADNGICQNVTYPRMRKVIEGYTDSKGNKVEGLGGNLSYLKTDFVPKYKELDKRELALSNKIYNLIKMSEEAHIEINVEEDFYKLYKSEVEENKVVAFYNRVLDYNELKTIQRKMEEFKDYKKIVYIRNGIDFEDKLINELQESGYIFKEIPEELMYL